MADLPARTRLVYDELVSFYRDNGYMPTIRELGARCGMSSTATVQTHIAKIVGAGLIVRDVRGGPRSIRILGLDSAADIVRDLASTDPVYFDDFRYVTTCVLCGVEVSPTTTSEHDDECPWLRARKLTGVE